MRKAVKKYGSGKFRVPDGCEFIKIDRFSGARLSKGAKGPNVVSECFREGEIPVFGITFDGGFAIGQDLPLVEDVKRSATKQVTTSTGKKAIVRKRKATVGEVLGGGLY